MTTASLQLVYRIVVGNVVRSDITFTQASVSSPARVAVSTSLPLGAAEHERLSFWFRQQAKLLNLNLKAETGTPFKETYHLLGQGKRKLMLDAGNFSGTFTYDPSDNSVSADAGPAYSVTPNVFFYILLATSRWLTWATTGIPIYTDAPILKV